MTDRIEVLLKNYDQMTDEGKDELLSIGERYLRDVDQLENDKLKFENGNIKISG
ncbi:hypothetical protein LQZ21_01255 [Treponema sp. TIM-1]|uniref:hypothetical protein n=1 Tax=Treponema sp. TIM-1 TaxID=2898417 RepID=UPI00397FBB9F